MKALYSYMKTLHEILLFKLINDIPNSTKTLVSKQIIYLSAISTAIEIQDKDMVPISLILSKHFSLITFKLFQ